jgi:hypothetical protein
MREGIIRGNTDMAAGGGILRYFVSTYVAIIYIEFFIYMQGMYRGGISY